MLATQVSSNRPIILATELKLMTKSKSLITKEVDEVLRVANKS